MDNAVALSNQYFLIFDHSYKQHIDISQQTAADLVWLEGYAYEAYR
jgi:hypothetical protein